MSHNPYYYQGANPTVDLIVINPLNEILLILRSEKAVACPNQWALPGGFIDSLSQKGEPWKLNLETPESAALREVKEETNLSLLSNSKILPVGIYEGNNRDPRDNEVSWSKSHAFFYQIDKDLYEKEKNNITGLDDASDCKWFSIDKLASLDLAFDHQIIIQDGLNKYFYKNKLKI